MYLLKFSRELAGKLSFNEIYICIFFRSSHRQDFISIDPFSLGKYDIITHFQRIISYFQEYKRIRDLSYRVEENGGSDLFSSGRETFAP